MQKHVVIKTNGKMGGKCRTNFMLLRVSIYIVMLIGYVGCASASVIFHEGWELSDDLPHSGGLYISGSADYCVNPDPPDDCSKVSSPCSCGQQMGYPPSTAFPDTCCRHSLNIGEGKDGFPVLNGKRSFRAYIAPGDAEVKSHTGRAEMLVRYSKGDGGAPLDAMFKDRWYGFGLYVPSQVNHTYEEVTFIQWHNVVAGQGEPLLFKLDGGPNHPWYKKYRWIAQGSSGGFQRFMEIPADDDFDRWVFWVIHVRWDNIGSSGIVEAWKDGEKVLTLDPFIYNYEGDGPPYMKMGITYSSKITDRPLIYFFDEFRIGDENSNFGEVNPSQAVTLPRPSIGTPELFKLEK